MSKRVAVLTSGGDAPGMNACIRGIILTCEKLGYTLFGYKHGYNGLLQQAYVPLYSSNTHNLNQQGGTILHSARCLEFKETESAILAAKHLDELEIDTLIVIGGDGSFRGATHLSHYWNGQILGLPGTIDNDISGTDATIGYYTAIDTAVSSIDKVRDTADAFERIFLVEVMGRHAGFLALSAALASAADYVILPELFTDESETIQHICHQIEQRRKLKGTVSFIIVVAENVWPGGISKLVDILTEKANAEVRPVILGHVQRGGSPVSQDRILANTLAHYAVNLVGLPTTNVMIGMVNGNPVEVPLSVTHTPGKPLLKSTLDCMESMMNKRYA